MSRYQCPEGYVQVTNIKVMQKLLLQLMVQFHEVCEKHGLVYNMCGGTLLGAVRHKGFIPWDDDLDVCMPRADYERFIEIIQKEYQSEFDIEVPCDKNYIDPFVKIEMKDTLLIEQQLLKNYGVRKLYIDVFPVDGYPSDLTDEALKKHFVKLRWLGKKLAYPCLNFVYPMRSVKEAVKHLLRWPLIVLYRIQGYEKYVKQFLELTQKYKFEDCDKVVWNWAYANGWWTEKSNFLDRVLYEFEGHKFWSVRDYDSWLTRIYGDYMTPPPQEKRVQQHGYLLYVKKDLLENL